MARVPRAVRKQQAAYFEDLESASQAAEGFAGLYPDRKASAVVLEIKTRDTNKTFYKIELEWDEDVANKEGTGSRRSRKVIRGKIHTKRGGEVLRRRAPERLRKREKATAPEASERKEA